MCRNLGFFWRLVLPEDGRHAHEIRWRGVLARIATAMCFVRIPRALTAQSQAAQFVLVAAIAGVEAERLFTPASGREWQSVHIRTVCARGAKSSSCSARRVVHLPARP